YFCAFVALATGVGLLWRATAALSVRAFLLYFVIWSLLCKARFIFIAPLQEGGYQSCGENAVIIAAASILYTVLAGTRDRQRVAFATGERGVRIARVLYALALIAFGLSHFFYVNLTVPLIPAWLPWHLGLAYFTGIAYLAAALAILTGVMASLAAV